MTRPVAPAEHEIPDEVIEGLHAVRESCQVNMFDRRGVIGVAVAMGYDETASWMRDKRNRSDYLAWVTGR